MKKDENENEKKQEASDKNGEAFCSGNIAVEICFIIKKIKVEGYMKRQDIFAQIISEVSGSSKSEVLELIESSKKLYPVAKWDEEVPKEEAEKMLCDLRKEGPGILAWLIEGYQKSIEHESKLTH